jgi:hypothetical protein
VTRRWRTGLGAGLVLVAALGASAVLSARDSLYDLPQPLERVLYLKSGRVAHVMAMGFDSLAADIYWIRTIQHYGGDRLSRPASGSFELLQPLLDLTTTLDPRFVVAYRFGAFFLAEPDPGGPGRPDQAIALLRKGLAADPRRWQYAHDIGFVYLFHFNDTASLKTAAAWFDRAAKMPGAPNWVQTLAANALIGADRAAARVSLQDLAAHADQPWLQRYAVRTLQQLSALDDIDELKTRVAEFMAARHAVPSSWTDLVRDGRLPGVPVDPAHVPYVLTGAGEVAIDARSPLAPLPMPRGRR